MTAEAQDLPPGWVDDVLEFWFGDVGSERWFVKDPELDAAIGARFSTLYEQLSKLSAASLANNAEQALASLIVLDQFSRNMFRNDARAFQADGLARDVAAAAIDAGYDKSFEPDRRVFMYLPFEHSEDMRDQEKSIELMGTLGRPDLLQWAQKHKDVIDRFGRYPHRNAALGRVSTQEEIEFLSNPGSSF